MVFASARAHLKQALGSPKFDPDFHVSELSELKLSIYLDKFNEALKESTKSMEEKMVAEEAKTSFPSEVKSKAMGMLNIPIDESAAKAFSDFQNKSINAMILTLDLSSETLHAEGLTNATIDSLVSGLKPDSPCYLLFEWAHEDQGAQKAKNIFVFYTPEDAPLKAKMIYSTISQNISQACVALGIEIEKKIQVSEAKEINESEIRIAVYGAGEQERTLFDKPKGPVRRAPGKKK
jgi:hypothetical protein